MKLLDRIYTFEEVKRIHFESKGYREAFDESIADWLFHLKIVNINDIQQHSMWDIAKLAVLATSNNKYRREYLHIKQLVSDLINGDQFPPVILGLKYDNGYEVRDGKHRLSAMR